MTSSDQKKANQQNAGRSTGPKTREGKKRASRNSRKHGLTISVFDDPVWSYDVVRLARGFRETGDPALHRHPEVVASTLVDLARIRDARTDLWTIGLDRQQRARAREDSPLEAQAVLAPADAQHDDVGELEVLACLEILSQLVRLERFQRIAFGRMKRVAKLLASGNL